MKLQSLAVVCLLATLLGSNVEGRKRRFRKQRNVPDICQEIAKGTHANTFSQCAAEVAFTGHKNPSLDNVQSGNLCSGLDETTCAGTQGCSYLGSGSKMKCVDVSSNSYCDQFASERSCKGEIPTDGSPAVDVDACYWKSDSSNPNGGQCLLKYQDCSLLGPDQCVQNDGCMWFNDLKKGHQAGPTTGSRGRCMADPCFRINNGRCTLQHTGGRCVWFTKAQNRKRGFNYAGCYTSPCNNRFQKSDCLEQNRDDANPYKCVWCGKVNGLKLGCQNAQATSKAQCWNLKNVGRNSPVPELLSNKCQGCLQRRTTESGECAFRSKKRKARCAEHCCQGPYCQCLARGVDNQAGLPGLNLG